MIAANLAQPRPTTPPVPLRSLAPAVACVYNHTTQLQPPEVSMSRKLLPALILAALAACSAEPRASLRIAEPLEESR